MSENNNIDNDSINFDADRNIIKRKVVEQTIPRNEYLSELADKFIIYRDRETKLNQHIEDMQAVLLEEKLALNDEYQTILQNLSPDEIEEIKTDIDLNNHLAFVFTEFEFIDPPTVVAGA